MVQCQQPSNLTYFLVALQHPCMVILKGKYLIVNDNQQKYEHLQVCVYLFTSFINKAYNYYLEICIDGRKEVADYI